MKTDATIQRLLSYWDEIVANPLADYLTAKRVAACASELRAVLEGKDAPAHNKAKWCSNCGLFANDLNDVKCKNNECQRSNEWTHGYVQSPTEKAAIGRW